MSEVLYEKEGAIATITLNRPERLNAISATMLAELSERLLVADRDREVRAIIVTGAGRGFCAGLDLVDATSGSGIGSSGGAGFPPTLDLRDAPPTVLHGIDKPTLCALNGGAAGYGMDIALGCDIRIAAESSKLAPGLHAPRGAAGERRHVVPAAHARLGQGRRDHLHRPHAAGAGVPRARPREPGRPGRAAAEGDARAGARDRGERADGRAGQQAHDAHGPLRGASRSTSTTSTCS